MRVKIFIIAIISFLCFSCVDYQDIKITEVYGVELKSFGLKNILSEATLTVDNTSSRNITIKELEIIINNNGKELVTIILKEPIKIKKKEIKQQIDGVFQIKMSGNILQLASLALNKESTVSLDVTSKIKTGIASKEFEFTSLRIEDLEKIIGINPLTLIK